MKQKTRPIKLTDLNSFEQGLVVLYNLDLSKDLPRLRALEQQAVIDYYLSDVHYLVVKRIYERDKKKSLTDEELDAILTGKSIYIGEIPKCFLQDGDMDRIAYDIDQLSKYNELYNCPNKGYILDVLVDTYAGRSKKLMENASTMSVKRHFLLDRIGIKTHLKQTNARLDEDLRVSRLKADEGKNYAKSLIEGYKSKFSA